MTKHIETRRKLCELDVSSLKNLFELIPLAEIDRRILELRYIKRHDFGFIADELGFSESTVKRRHKEVLSRIQRHL